MGLRHALALALTSDQQERMQGEAAYTNHRLFQTSVRIVGER